MHFGDSIFIFLLALVLFGPKKLPEIGRTVGKLLAEFRRASNEFKFQIQEELRNMEDEERKKKLAEAQAAKAAADPLLATSAAVSTESTPTILPPSIGATVSTGAPYATPGDATRVPPETTAVSPPTTPMVPASSTEVTVEPTALISEATPAAPQPVRAPPMIPTGESLAHPELTTRTNGAHPAEPAASPVASPLESIPADESVPHG